MDIRVEMIQLSELADRMQTTENALEVIREALEKTTKDMDSWWLGSGREAYEQLKEKRIEDIKRFQELVRNNKASLQTAVYAYMQEEGELIKAVGELSTDNIF